MVDPFIEQRLRAALATSRQLVADLREQKRLMRSTLERMRARRWYHDPALDPSLPAAARLDHAGRDLP